MVCKTSSIQIQQGVKRSFSGRVQGMITAGVLALVVSACATEQREVVAPISQAPASPSPTTPASPTTATPVAPATPASPTASPTTSPIPITRPLAELVGQNVTVSTKVQKVITPNVFTVYDVESLRGQTVLVVSKNPAPPANTNIEMTGVVRNLVVADVEKEYGIDITPEVEQEYVNQPFVAAVAIGRVN
ncbi:hypothetical protein ACQ4M3_06155 [Leptolyngbya sp. AN03gr2]|uniref:hypothetical protein n=1 Tax=unclassified Leptolyngbya TaxID=2650499 RepID=UPI003D321D4E